MRAPTAIALLILAGCRPTAPVTAADVDDEPAPTAEPTPIDEPAPPEGGENAGGEETTPEITVRRAQGIVDELVETINAALAGRELPATSMIFPGSRGEQVVRLQAEGFPRGELVAAASMLKVDVTLEDCEPNGGLTIGFVQSTSGIHIVGLGDRFLASTGPTPEPLAEVVALTEHLMEELAGGNGGELVLQDAECERDFGGIEHCRRLFQELPNAETLERYQRLLSSCEAHPVYALTVVGLWLRDEAGTEFQAIARMRNRGERPVVTEPILLGSGLR